LRRQLNARKREQYPWMFDVTKCAAQEAIIDLGVAFRAPRTQNSASRSASVRQSPVRVSSRAIAGDTPAYAGEQNNGCDLTGQCERRGSAPEVLAVADAALYRAKDSGRNCVIVA
jgi:hypothetical protein